MSNSQKAIDFCVKLNNHPSIGKRQSQDPDFVKLCLNNDQLGHVFLVCCDNFFVHTPKNAFGRDLSDLSQWFTRPNPAIKYWILKNEFRNMNFIINTLRI